MVGVALVAFLKAFGAYERRAMEHPESEWTKR
jgi:hypothetical protein